MTHPSFVQYNAKRFLSDKPATAPKSVGASISGLWQRLSAFVIGAGLTALATQFFIYGELKEGNKLMLLKQKELELRLEKLEKKK
jgi:hypothetical protein